MKAVRGLLILSSPTFRRMIKESTKGQIVLEDIDPNAFEITMKYIIAGVQAIEKDLHVKKMASVLYAAKK